MNQQSPTVLLTRPVAQSTAFAARIHERCGAHIPIVTSEVLRIVFTAQFDQIPLSCDLVFTSARAVEAYDLHQIERGHRAFCVGTQTAQAAEQAGCHALTAKGTVAALQDLILRSNPNSRMVYLSGEHVSAALDDDLAAKGIQVEKRVVYDQIAHGLSGAAKALLGQRVRLIVPVFSARSAAALSGQIRVPVAEMVIIFISQASADAWQGDKHTYSVVDHPDGDAMLQAVCDALATEGWVEGRDLTS